MARTTTTPDVNGIAAHRDKTRPNALQNGHADDAINSSPATPGINAIETNESDDRPSSKRLRQNAKYKEAISILEAAEQDHEMVDSASPATNGLANLSPSTRIENRKLRLKTRASASPNRRQSELALQRSSPPEGSGLPPTTATTNGQNSLPTNPVADLSNYLRITPSNGLSDRDKAGPHQNHHPSHSPAHTGHSHHVNRAPTNGATPSSAATPSQDRNPTRKSPSRSPMNSTTKRGPLIRHLRNSTPATNGISSTHQSPAAMPDEPPAAVLKREEQSRPTSSAKSKVLPQSAINHKASNTISLPIATPSDFIKATEQATNSARIKELFSDHLDIIAESTDKKDNLSRAVDIALDKSLSDYHEEQRYIVQMNLKKARAAAIVEADSECRQPILQSSAARRDDPNFTPWAPNGMAGMRTQSPFASMNATQMPMKWPRKPTHAPMSFDTLGPSGKRASKGAPTFMEAQITTWVDDTPKVPEYTHCTWVSRNVACENEVTMHVYPYFGDDVDERVYEALQNNYDVDIDARPRKVFQVQRSRQLLPYVSDFLDSLNCDEGAVLWYLLNPITPIGTEHERNICCAEDFDRTGKRWIAVFRKLPTPNPAALRMAYLACLSFSKKTKLSLWHIVRKSHHAKLLSDDKEQNALIKKPILHQIQELACTVCHEHDCNYHADYLEISGSEGEVEAVDIDWPLQINQKRRMTVKYSDSLDRTDHITVASTKDKVAYAKLVNSMANTDVHGRDRYYPCDHDGKCSAETHCPCFEQGIPCEKACACTPACERRFNGCSCHTLHRRTVCFKDDRCECFRAKRECDPDVCKGCRADSVLDPVNRYNELIQKTCCQNVHIQLAKPKRTILGASKIHGFGVYAGEPIKKYDFVGEYKGESISQEEQSRRAETYAYTKMSYLFMLTNDQEVDSHHIGNKMRFINHARTVGARGACNTEPSVMLCNMTPRIGMYALRDIAVGEELFFDYGEHYNLLVERTSNAAKGKPERATKGGRGKGKALVRKKNTGLTKDFAEPEYEEVEPTGEGMISKTVKARYNPRSATAVAADSDDEDPFGAPAARKSGASLMAPNSAISLSDDDDDEADALLDFFARPGRGADDDESEFEMDESDEAPRKRGGKRKRGTSDDMGPPRRGGGGMRGKRRKMNRGGREG